MTVLASPAAAPAVPPLPAAPAPAASDGPTRIPLSAPVNLRDLGGIPVRGGVIRSGFAIRTDDLAYVTDEAAAELVEGGLRAIIDLRSAAEAELTGRGPLGGVPTVAYHHVPFMTSIDPADTAPGVSALDQSTFGELYRNLYVHAAPQIVTSLAIVAHAPGAVAFHCAAGQDRTGVLAASLLLTLGADPEHILADYARTGENTAAIRARIMPVLRPLMRGHGVDLDAGARAAARTSFSPAPMRQLLEALHEGGADPLAPLRDAGLTDGLVDRLRERALTR